MSGVDEPTRFWSLDEANGALRDAFGAASLPEDVPPSAVAQARHR